MMSKKSEVLLRRTGRGVLAVGTTTAIVLSLAVVAGVGSAASQATPANAGEPVISGDAVVGSTMTATQGTWTGGPTSFAFQWLRCPSSGGASDGSDCAALGGATTQAYVVSASDVGSRLRVRVTASNAEGSASATSNASALVVAQDQSPRNTAQPAISGSARVGSTLTATQGTWTGTPTSFAYQWVRCASSGGSPDGSDCAVIGGARTQAYIVASADLGSRLRVRVTATNTSGSTTVASNATALVTAQSQRPANTSQPSISGTARAGSTLTASTGQWTNNPTSYAYQWTRCPASGGKPDASDCAARPVQGMLVYVTAVPYNQFTVPAEQPTGTDGWAQLTMRRARSFPAAEKQQLLVMFVRARKNGENVLGGISTRRLVSFPVNLSR